MQAAVIAAPGRAVVETRDTPHAAPGEVVVQVAACGVCGTDVHLLHGGFRAHYPLLPGHEFSGTVVEAGAGVTHLAVGDRVVIDPNIACGQCPYCRRGLIHFCENLTALGVDLPGGFAEYSVLPAAQAYRVPESLSFEAAAFTEPLACCLHGLDRACIAAGDRVVLLGAGPIGLLMLQLVRLAGAATVMVSEPVATKRELAASLGADEVVDPNQDDLAARVRARTEIGADVVIECVGAAATVSQALTLPRRGGRVVLFGVSPKEAEVPVRPYDVFINELTLVGSYINPFTHARALELLAAGRVRVEPLISHRLPLSRFPQALDLAGGGSAMKVIVAPGV
jgi:L-iditol 2-dehydrogenase